MLEFVKKTTLIWDKYGYFSFVFYLHSLGIFEEKKIPGLYHHHIQSP
jgi:hypothetical protein